MLKTDHAVHIYMRCVLIYNESYPYYFKWQSPTSISMKPKLFVHHKMVHRHLNTLVLSFLHVNLLLLLWKKRLSLETLLECSSLIPQVIWCKTKSAIMYKAPMAFRRCFQGQNVQIGPFKRVKRIFELVINLVEGIENQYLAF